MGLCEHCKKREKHEDYRYCLRCLPGKRDFIRLWIEEHTPILPDGPKPRSPGYGAGKRNDGSVRYPAKWRRFSGLCGPIEQ